MTLPLPDALHEGRLDVFVLEFRWNGLPNLLVYENRILHVLLGVAQVVLDRDFVLVFGPFRFLQRLLEQVLVDFVLALVGEDYGWLKALGNLDADDI